MFYTRKARETRVRHIEWPFVLGCLFWCAVGALALIGLLTLASRARLVVTQGADKRFSVAEW